MAASWDERLGILEHKDGYVTVGFHCDRCEQYAVLSQPFDDFDEEALRKELCPYHNEHRLLVLERWEYRRMKREFRRILNIADEESENHECLLAEASKLLAEQDSTIRRLRIKLRNKT